MITKRLLSLLLAVAVAGVLAAAALAGVNGTAAKAPDGKALFKKSCGGCHTLKAAGTKGTFGPNLNKRKPSKARVIATVTNGRGGMPAFKGKLTKAQIAAIATFVDKNT